MLHAAEICRYRESLFENAPETGSFFASGVEYSFLLNVLLDLLQLVLNSGVVQGEATNTNQNLSGFFLSIHEKQPARRLAEEEARDNAETHEDDGGDPDNLVLHARAAEPLVQEDAVDAKCRHTVSQTHHDGEPGSQDASNLCGRNLDQGDWADDNQATDSGAADDARRIESGNVGGDSLEHVAEYPNANVQTVGPETAETVIEPKGAGRANAVAKVDEGDEILDLACLRARRNTEMLLEAGQRCNHG